MSTSKPKKPSESVVSDGNQKIGKTPNVSLLPVLTCAREIPCAEKCYCMKALRTYQGVQEKWYANTVKWVRSPNRFRDDIDACLNNNPKYFRWFVAGDIPDASFLTMMVSVADNYPGTKFLAFTKRYEFFSQYVPKHGYTFYPRSFLGLPDNLTIVMSRWGDWKYPWFFGQPQYPTSSVIFKGGVTPPENATQFICPGKCEGCRKCWDLKVGQTVMFKEH
jgi:hypothetical protein